MLHVLKVHESKCFTTSELHYGLDLTVTCTNYLVINAITPPFKTKSAITEVGPRC